MRKTILLLIILSSGVSLLMSQQTAITKTGTTAASFLKIGLGARSVGMGGAFTAAADDISALYWNSAGLARMTFGEVSFNHIDWFAGIDYEMAAAALVIDGFGTVAASISTMSVGEMEVTTTGMPEGTGEMFNAGALLFQCSFARNLSDKFSLGISVKYIRESIWNMSAQGAAIDVGTMYTAPILNGVTLGASISNFGPKMGMTGRDNLILIKTGPSGDNIVNGQYELDQYDLPLLFRVGVATDLMKEENNRLTIAADAVHPNDNTEYVNSGLEYCWGNTVSLRAGWKSAFERGTEQGLTFGGGVNYSFSPQIDVLVDYAYLDFGRLMPVHYLSFGLRY